MQQYLKQKDTTENERRKTSIINQYESPNRKIYDLPLYILIRETDEKYLPPVIKEFERFGEIKEVINDENCRFILISYHNPENARIAYEHHNKFVLDPFTKQHTIRVELLHEEAKNKFLRENLHEKNYMTDKQELGMGRMNMVYNLPNTRDYTYSTVGKEKSKTNMQKFVEIFFNL
jgi:hypothetical protein